MNDGIPPQPNGRNPRVAYLFSRYPVISQTFVDNEILGLEAAGWEVVICSIHPPHNCLRHPRLNNLRAPVCYAPPPEVRKGLQKVLASTGSWPGPFLDEHTRAFGPGTRAEVSCRNVAHFAELLPRLEVDHLHIHFANRATHGALMLKEMKGITFSFTPQAQDFLLDISSPELLAEMCRQAEFVVVACDWAREHLARLVPGSRGKVHRIYNGIDPAPYPMARPAPRDGLLKVASVGRLIEFKGFHHLIGAIGRLRDRQVRVQLDLMGDGPWREQLENQVRDLGLGDQIVFHGSVTTDQMRECYARVDAFALACIEDRKGAMDVFPTVITEAMLSWLPVVSCRIAGVPEQVVDGVTGFLTEPGDEAALANALYSLATEPGLAARLGTAGHERAVAHFDIAKTLPLLESQLRGLPARHPKLPSTPIGAFYDLSAGGSAALREFEREVLDALGSQVWVAGGQLTRKEAERFASAGVGGFWLPDGMALESEWIARPDYRDRVDSLRDELDQLGEAVDTEEFFTAARRAVWMAIQSARLGAPAMWYSPTEAEALVVWMVHRLTGSRFALAGDAGSALAQRLSAMASASALASPGRNLLLRPGADGTASFGGLLSRLPLLQRRRERQRRAALTQWLRSAIK